MNIQIHNICCVRGGQTPLGEACRSYPKEGRMTHIRVNETSETKRLLPRLPFKSLLDIAWLVSELGKSQNNFVQQNANISQFLEVMKGGAFNM